MAKDYLKRLLTENWELEIWFFILFWENSENIAGRLKGIKPGRKVKRKGKQASTKELKEIMQHSPELWQAARGRPGEAAADNKWSQAETWFIQRELKTEAKEEAYIPLK